MSKPIAMLRHRAKRVGAMLASEGFTAEECGRVALFLVFALTENWRPIDRLKYVRGYFQLLHEIGSHRPRHAADSKELN